MLYEVGQAAAEAAKVGSSLTGSFILDGASLIAVLKIVEAVISKAKGRGWSGNGGANGTVRKPGEGKTCEAHTGALADLTSRVTTIEANETNRKEALDLFRQQNEREHRDLLQELKSQRRVGQ